MGLVQQVLDCAPRWLIRKATQTYLTLGIADIAKETGNPDLDQNRAIVLSMVSVSFVWTARYVSPHPCGRSD